MQDAPVKRRKLQYDRENLLRAYEATQKGVSMYRAARQYSVPEQTLRDRTKGLVDLDAKIGFDTIFNKDEEDKLVGHITYMAEIGYGYNASGIKYMAKDYADSLGKHVKAKEALSNNRFYNFLKRWPNLKVVKPQKLSIARAKSASRDTLNNYYKELGTILTNNGLRDKPQNIYNIDETGVSTEHNPPKVVCDSSIKPQNITSTRSSTVTIIASGNALGNSIPPYYIFPGQRWNEEFLKGACPGSMGEMSKKGWSNSLVFHNYMTKHFSKYVKLSEDKASVPTLVLFDGHKSHITLTLAEWARRYNVILFVLPPHSSHVTQPLDVAVFGPFKAIYYSECQAYMKKYPGANITHYQIAELTNKPYLKALSAENLISAFRRTGIHPFDNKAVPDSEVAPSLIYRDSTNDNEDTNQEAGDEDGQPQANNQDDQQEHSETNEEIPDITATQASEDETNIKDSAVSDFFERRTITKVIQPKRKRKFVPPFIAGSLLKKSNTEILKASAQKALDKQKSITTKVTPVKCTERKQNSTLKNTQKNTKSHGKTKREDSEPRPSTSGTSKAGGPINLSQSSQNSDDSEYVSQTKEEDKCCVCHTFEAEYLKHCDYISFVSWGKCDFCPHWTHLKSCTEVRVLRRGSVFRCPHCLDEE